MLTKEQQIVYEKLNTGKNIFISGHAGTGKSFVLQKFIQEKKDEGLNVVVCAPTGIAALNIDGYTIHRSFKVPIDFSLISKEERLILPNKTMRAADIVIIDEISMCSYELFRYISVQFFKCNDKHKQMIVCGDFFQLPPVIKSEDKYHYTKIFPDYNEGFAFDCPYWNQYNFEVCELNEVVRQEDKEYIKELNKARSGDLSCIEYFNSRVMKDKVDENVLRLFPKNSEVNKYNMSELDRLNTLLYKNDAYVVELKGKLSEGDFAAPKELLLKVGARVMMVVNDKKGQYKNGSMGTIVNIYKSVEIIVVKLDDGKMVEIGKHTWEIKRPKIVEYLDENNEIKYKAKDELIGLIVQYPLKLAYAVTIHKSQGQTFDNLVVDPSCFTFGQLYVALSRCSNIEGLYLTKEIKESYLTVSFDVIEFYKHLNDKNKYIDIKVPIEHEAAINEFLQNLHKKS